MRNLIVRSLFVLLALVGCAESAAAQWRNSWGVIGSFVPTWEVPRLLSDRVIGVGDGSAVSSAVDIRGSEFRVGFVRGKVREGDWGMSFIRKRFSRDAMISESSETEGFSYSLEDVTLTGVEIHKFSPISTIKRRVQIGLTYGIGVAQMKGQARGIEFDQSGTRVVERPVDAMFDADEEDGRLGLLNVGGYTLKPVPLAKFELTGSALVAPGLKVRASGGFNFPGYHAASVSVVYLFGQ